MLGCLDKGCAEATPPEGVADCFKCGRPCATLPIPCRLLGELCTVKRPGRQGVAWLQSDGRARQQGDLLRQGCVDADILTTQASNNIA